MYKLIYTAKGEAAKVSPEDYNWLNQWKWRLSESGYFVRLTTICNKRVRFFMHREIVGAGKGEEVDHIDLDRVNNQRNNLRICTINGNKRNRIRRADSTMRYKGVYRGQHRKYGARIQKKHLGYFETQEDAARAYDKAAKELFGEFARLNFP